MSQNPLETLESARNAYEQSAWADATDLFLSADAESDLEIDDLEALVWAAGISAQDRVMLAALERVYTHHAANENHEDCVRAAFWCGLRNMLIGEVGLGSGWLQRAARHAEQTSPDCVQRGYLLLPQVYMHRGKGAYEAAIDVADKAIVPIDEAMLLANSQRLSPVVSGVVYCEIVASCCRVLEMVRAREWTAICAKRWRLTLLKMRSLSLWQRATPKKSSLAHQTTPSSVSGCFE